MLDVVERARLDLLDEAVRGAHIGHHGALEAADLGLPRVAPVEEDDLVAAFCDQLVHRARAEVGAATDHTRGIDLRLFGNAEGHELIAHLDAELREIGNALPRHAAILALEHVGLGGDVAGAVAPLHVESLERRVFAGQAKVALARIDLAADGAVDAVLRDDDAAAQPERLAQLSLPEAHGLRVGDGSERVVEQDLRVRHPSMVRGC